MADVNDMDLLREYADRNSEAAFAAFVQRHVNLVYSVALRYLGNSPDAQDVTQTVFIILARKAASLRHRTTLTGWLYETTRFTARQFLRTRTRQQAREQEAYMQSTVNEPDTAGVWRQLSPALEDAMTQLSEGERELLAIRYFENKSAAETAALLGIQEWAAHKRTARALEKLRKRFSKHGVTLTTATIAGAISANSIQAAPVTLAKTVAAAALANTAAAGGSTLTLVKGALKVMAWTQTKTAIVVIAVASLAVFSLRQHQAHDKLREQNESLQSQLAELQAQNEQLLKRKVQTPHLPAPQIQTALTPAPPIEETQSANLFDRLKNKDHQLTREQVESYLKTAGRNATTLLAAFRTSGDTALLREAMETSPNNPQVAFEAVLNKELSPAEQRQWLDTFEESAPDNALANYLSALNYFNAGQTDKAVQELSAASGKAFDDYTASRMEDDVEPYLAAGDSIAEAKTTATMQLMLPQLAQLKQLGLDTVDLANAYRQSGDTASAQAALQAAANLGQQYSNPTPGEPVVSRLVGTYIENAALSAMDPTAPYGNPGQTVQDHLNQLAQEKAVYLGLNQQVEPLLPTLSDQDWIIYKDRWLMFGEQNAQQWVVNKYGRQ